MPSLIVEDIAPFLHYTPSNEWRLGLDNLTQSSGGTITVTASAASTVCFSFYGTGVGIYGTRRFASGLYRVKLNDSALNTESAEFQGNIWGQTLFKDSALPKGTHRVCLENMENKLRDLDYIILDPSIGSDDETVTAHTVQDTDPSFSYDPLEQWTLDAPDVHAYSAGSGHATNIIGSSARLRFKVRTLPPRFKVVITERIRVIVCYRFSKLNSSIATGDAIALYGPAGTKAAPSYSVRVDNRSAEIFSASTFSFNPLRPQQLMYFGGNLGPGEHELEVKLEAAIPEQFLVIDYAQIFTTPSIGGDTPLLGVIPSTNSTATPKSASNPNSIPAGLLAAIVVTGSIAFLALALLLWIFLLIKRGKLRRPVDPERTNRRLDPLFVSGIFQSEGTASPGLAPVPYFVGPIEASQVRRKSRVELENPRPTGPGRSQAPPPVYSNP
ncbi:hypothetical protein BKA70DRAFT_1521549 [Coprinopsis sp. MPI-PUGE-AT-0042]|nr:hypothetical protein BKA70DRAFT_1521549 [Coprinopsis sp. MPI-PUGE-AT-0042]